MRTRRLVTALLAALAACWTLFVGTPAYAASPDSYDRFDVVYTVGADGVTHVDETIVYRFSSSSRRHGYQRDLITREPRDADHDRVYRVSGVHVTSPDRVSTHVEMTDDTSGRNAVRHIRIGDPDRRIASPTVTYQLSYDVAGYLRNPDPAFDEFYLDALGPDLGDVKNATVTVKVPGGVQDISCWAGTPGRSSTTPCSTKSLNGGVATLTQQLLPSGQVLTLDAKITKGAAGTAAEILVPNADVEAAREAAEAARAATTGAGAGLGAGLLGTLVAWLAARPRFRDERYAGTPPGAFPADPAGASAVPDWRPEIPVAFSPPRIPVADAGYLLNGGSRTEDTTATLVQLAAAGAIRLETTTAGSAQVTALDPSRVPDERAQTLYDALFGDGFQVVHLGERGELRAASELLEQDVRAAVTRQGWFKAAPGASAMGCGSLVLLAGIGLAIVSWGGGGFMVGAFAFLATLVGVLAVGRVALAAKLRRGQRSAVGRAYTDQVEGFRTYLTTAEASQLRFEEGEDIFSRYLPWAIMFGVAERWAAICDQAIRAGYMPAPSLGWAGLNSWDLNWMLWNLNTWNHASVSSMQMPMDAGTGGSSWSGSGFGGDSGFSGGGGFAGGGSGGGGGGGW